MTGLDLKLKRVAADVKAKDIADVLRVTPGYVSQIERNRLVSPDLAARYVAALDTCITKSTRPASAA